MVIERSHHETDQRLAEKAAASAGPSILADRDGEYDRRDHRADQGEAGRPSNSRPTTKNGRVSATTPAAGVSELRLAFFSLSGACLAQCRCRLCDVWGGGRGCTGKSAGADGVGGYRRGRGRGSVQFVGVLYPGLIAKCVLPPKSAAKKRRWRGARRRASSLVSYQPASRQRW